MRKALIASLVALAINADPAQAHALKCSTHRSEVKSLKYVKVDDLPGAQCVDMGYRRIRFVRTYGRYVWRQDVWHIGGTERWHVTMKFRWSKPRLGYFG